MWVTQSDYEVEGVGVPQWAAQTHGRPGSEGGLRGHLNVPIGMVSDAQPGAVDRQGQAAVVPYQSCRYATANTSDAKPPQSSRRCSGRRCRRGSAGHLLPHEVVMGDCRERCRSRVKGVALFLGTVTVYSIFEVLLFATPAPPKDLAVVTAIWMIVKSLLLGAALIWDRRRQKSRRYLGG